MSAEETKTGTEKTGITGKVEPIKNQVSKPTNPESKPDLGKPEVEHMNPEPDKNIFKNQVHEKPQPEQEKLNPQPKPESEKLKKTQKPRTLQGKLLTNYDITNYCTMQGSLDYIVIPKSKEGLNVRSANGETNLTKGTFRVRNLQVILNENIKIKGEHEYIIVSLISNAISIRGVSKKPHWFAPSTMLLIKKIKD